MGKARSAGVRCRDLGLAVMEFPPPIRFETRPHSGASPIWLVLFLAILVSEITAMILIFKRPGVGAKFAMLAAVLNIIEIFADQLHLMQPEVAPLGYSGPLT